MPKACNPDVPELLLGNISEAISSGEKATRAAGAPGEEGRTRQRLHSWVRSSTLAGEAGAKRRPGQGEDYTT